MSQRIDIPENAIEDFCRRNRIRRLALFGSVIRDDFGPESGVDVLVEFEPDAQVGLSFFGMEQELSELLGHEVDLNTTGFLSRHVRETAIREAETVYERA